MNYIKNSLEWNAVEIKFVDRARGLIHERDMMRMIDNVSTKVSDLSKLEVLARRGKVQAARMKLEEVNKDIETIEEFLLIATLID